MFSFEYNEQTHQMNIKKSSSASLNAAIFGVPKFFVPQWFNWNIFQYNNSHEFNILPSQRTYVYDNTSLEKTLEKYIDFKKLSPNVKLNNSNTENSTIDGKNIPRPYFHALLKMQ
jgi:NTE family protein